MVPNWPTKGKSGIPPSKMKGVKAAFPLRVELSRGRDSQHGFKANREESSLKGNTAFGEEFEVPVPHGKSHSKSQGGGVPKEKLGSHRKHRLVARGLFPGEPSHVCQAGACFIRICRGL